MSLDCPFMHFISPQNLQCSYFHVTFISHTSQCEAYSIAVQFARIIVMYAVFHFVKCMSFYDAVYVSLVGKSAIQS